MLSISDPPATLSPSTMLRLEAIDDSLREIDEASRAPRTIDAYRSDWRQVQAWAASFGLGLDVPEPEQLSEALPVLFVRKYLAERRHEVSAATLTRHLAAMRHWHHEAALMSPTSHPDVAKAMAGIRRKESSTQRQVRPIYATEMLSMVETLPEGVKGDRDRAVLLVGHQGGFRRSELAALDVGDISDTPKGVAVNLRKSKTDQEGRGRQIGVNYAELLQHPLPVALCAVRAFRTWSKALPDKSGPAFRQVDRWGNVRGRISGQTVAAIVKEGVERIGLNPDDYSGHSLRAGCVTQSNAVGAPKSAIRFLTGHASDTMLDVYVRPGDLMESSAVNYWGKAFEGVEQ